MNRAPWRAHACLAAAMLLVGSYVALSKLLVTVFPVLLLAWLRFGIAAVAMAGWLRRPAGEAPLGRRDRRLLFCESLFGNFLFSVCMLFGVAHSSAVAAGVTLAAIPAVVALLSWAALRERIRLPVAGGVVCAVTGIGLVAVSHPAAQQIGGGQALGSVLLAGAVVCEALYVVIGKQLTATVGPRRIAAIVNLWGLALTTPFGLWQARQFDFAAVLPQAWALLVVYALAASMWTVWLWMRGLQHVPASAAGVFTVLLPIGTALVGVTVLGERFSAVQAGAFGLALAGVLLATWPARAGTAR